MFGIASRLNVQVGVVARDALRLHRIVLAVRGELLDAIENLLTDEVALLYPSCRAGCSADFNEVAIVVKHFHAITIFHHSSFFVHRSYVVAKDGLDSGDVGDFEDAAAAAIAG